MYEVESVMNKRINPKTSTFFLMLEKPEYEVKWAGFHVSENTWEPEENLIFVKHLLEKYEKSNPKKGGPSPITQLKKTLNNPQSQKINNNIYKFKNNVFNFQILGVCWVFRRRRFR